MTKAKFYFEYRFKEHDSEWVRVVPGFNAMPKTAGEVTVKCMCGHKSESRVRHRGRVIARWKDGQRQRVPVPKRGTTR